MPNFDDYIPILFDDERPEHCDYCNEDLKYCQCDDFEYAKWKKEKENK